MRNLLIRYGPTSLRSTVLSPYRAYLLGGLSVTRRAGSRERCWHTDLLLRRAAISPVTLRLDQREPRLIPIQLLSWEWSMRLRSPSRARVPVSMAFLRNREKYASACFALFFERACRFRSCSGWTIDNFSLGIEGFELCLKTRWNQLNY